MFLAAIAGLALAIYFGTSYLGKSKGTDQEPSAAAAAAAAAASPTTTTATAATPSVCTDALRADLLTEASYTAWITPLNTQITAIGAPATPTPQNITDITTVRDNLSKHYACLQELKATVDKTSTTYATLQTKAVNIDKAIAQAKLDIQIAKDRAALALEPTLNRSYYDGWFPMERPLKHMTYPLLIGFGLFFFSLALMLFLALVGIDVTMLVKVPALSPGTQFTSAFFVMGGIAVTLLGLTVYGFTR